MPYETIDKEYSIISVENLVYGHNDDSRKIKAKIPVESWRKRKKRNYSYQVKPNLKSKWRISFKKPNANKKIYRSQKGKKNSNVLSHSLGRQRNNRKKQNCDYDTGMSSGQFVVYFEMPIGRKFESKPKIHQYGISDIIDYPISDNYNETKHQ